ncbi:unnamed protein product [Citrullus colocynthis]|uniref:Uncharacterized protein n=1 Tax=Citrullus colocynthis TaxID=252529 RepID=A0ABP0Z8Z1_9ROSI
MAASQIPIPILSSNIDTMETLRRHSGAASCRSSTGIGTMETIKEIRSRKEQVVEATKSSKKSMEKWWNDPENKRKRRVTKYKFYAVDAKVKNSIKKGFKWMKNKCSKIISGF